MKMQNGFKKRTGADSKLIKVMNLTIATVMITIPETIRDLTNQNSDVNSKVKICKKIIKNNSGKNGKSSVTVWGSSCSLYKRFLELMS